MGKQKGYRPSKRARRFGRWVVQMRSADPKVREEAERRRQEGQDFQRRRKEANIERLEIAQVAGVDPEDLLAYEHGQLLPEEYNPPDFVERIDSALKALAAKSFRVG